MDPLALALIDASRHGSLVTVKVLLDLYKEVHANHFNFIIDYGGPDYMTALMHASANGHLDIVKVLIENGATVDLATPDNKFTALMLASFMGHLDVVRRLLTAGAKVNAVATEGMTALMYASMKRHLDVARLLIQQNANPELKNSAGRSAKDLAGEFWEEIIKAPASPTGGRRKSRRRKHR